MFDRTSCDRHPRRNFPCFAAAALLTAVVVLSSASVAQAQMNDFLKGLFGGGEEDSAAREEPAAADSSACPEIMRGMRAAKYWPESCGTGRPPGPSKEARIFDGVWDVEMPGNPFYAGAVISVDIDHGLMSLRDPNTNSPASGLVRYKKESWFRHFNPNASVTESGSLKTRLGNWAFCNCVPFWVEVKPTGQPGVMLGEWSYEQQRGLAVWRRRPGPEIKQIALWGARYGADGKLTSDSYAYGTRLGLLERRHRVTCGHGQMRGNCDGFWITILGENFAGSPSLWIDPAHHMEIREARWVCRDKEKSVSAWYKCPNNPGPGHHVVGIAVKLLLWDGIKPGPRTFWVNKQPVPFDFVIHGYPEEDQASRPKLVTLKALGLEGETLAGLTEASPFLLEAVYEADHPDPWVEVSLPGFRPIVTLDSPLGGGVESGDIVERRSEVRKVLLQRTEDPKVFRSLRHAVAAGSGRDERKQGRSE